MKKQFIQSFFTSFRCNISTFQLFNFSTSLRFIFLLFTFFFFILPLSTSAQVIYEPTYKDVYKYLDRLNSKGIIEFDDLIVPVSRDYIAEKLIEADGLKDKLTSLERDELKFYEKEYGNEILKIKGKRQKAKGENQEIGDRKHEENQKIDSTGFEYVQYGSDKEKNVRQYTLFKNDKYGRFRVFSYTDNRVQLFVNPILGFEYTNWDSKSYTHIWNGLQFYGSFGDHIGFSMDFRDNTESGEIQDSFRTFTPEQGFKKNGRGSFQFNILNAMVSYKWNWGSISIGKTPFEWGYAENGKIVHSSKAPSYPNIRLDLEITDWLSFNYMYGWLNSEVIDSNESYKSFRENPPSEREVFRSKYIASHTLNIKPIKGLSFALGESIIISDRAELAYFIPVMFFRSADHYLSSQNNNAGSNSQFFFNLSSRNHIPNTHLYASLFIDEIITGDVFNSQKSKNQLAYTFGSSIVDFPVKNSNIKIEYSHMNPFVYQHYIPTQVYSNQGYNLGHWLGHNSDILHLSYEQRCIRGLTSKIWTEFIRKGGNGNADLMYTIPQPEFLFGLNTKYDYYGIDLNYEFIHDLNLRLKYQYSSIDTEYEKGKFNKDSFNTFKMAVYYGL